jgi:hypothetical protein
MLRVSAFLLLVSAALLAVVMSRKQTGIDVPEPGQDVELSGLNYKGAQFEAKVTSVKLELKGDATADPVEAEWVFLASNSDGQLHRVEIYARPLDESGKQLGQFSKGFHLNAGARDQVCKVPMKIKSADWKAVKTIRIVADWMS